MDRTEHKDVEQVGKGENVLNFDRVLIHGRRLQILLVEQEERAQDNLKAERDSNYHILARYSTRQLHDGINEACKEDAAC